MMGLIYLLRLSAWWFWLGLLVVLAPIEISNWKSKPMIDRNLAWFERFLEGWRLGFARSGLRGWQEAFRIAAWPNRLAKPALISVWVVSISGTLVVFVVWLIDFLEAIEDFPFPEG